MALAILPTSFPLRIRKQARSFGFSSLLHAMALAILHDLLSSPYSESIVSGAKARFTFIGYMRGLNPPPPSGLRIGLLHQIKDLRRNSAAFPAGSIH
jgi:hypothetical protein